MNIKNPTIIIQARTDSHRFPKKVLKRINNKPLLYYVIERSKTSKLSKNVIIATTRKKSDESIVNIAKRMNVDLYRGPTKNVLKRFYECAVKFNVDPIIRITGDCPLIDSKIIDKHIKIFQTGNYDYVTNILDPTSPDGLDVEVFSFKLLKKLNKICKFKSEKEHVTSYIINNQKKFKIYNLKMKDDYSHIRLTVDEIEDLKLIKKIYQLKKPLMNFCLKEILDIIEKYPHLLKINSKHKRDEGYQLSLLKD